MLLLLFYFVLHTVKNEKKNAFFLLQYTLIKQARRKKKLYAYGNIHRLCRSSGIIKNFHADQYVVTCRSGIELPSYGGIFARSHLQKGEKL
jgi:hypothetical protein